MQVEVGEDRRASTSSPLRPGALRCEGVRNDVVRRARDRGPVPALRQPAARRAARPQARAEARRLTSWLGLQRQQRLVVARRPGRERAHGVVDHREHLGGRAAGRAGQRRAQALLAERLRARARVDDAVGVEQQQVAGREADRRRSRGRRSGATPSIAPGASTTSTAPSARSTSGGRMAAGARARRRTPSPSAAQRAARRGRQRLRRAPRAAAPR